MLLDSNIVMYAAKPEYEMLRKFIAEQTPAVSAITRVEVLGYHQLSPEDQQEFEEFFEKVAVLPLSEQIIENAIALRQRRKMSLGDALIAGTALTHDLMLVTANIRDFDWIDELDVVNPLK